MGKNCYPKDIFSAQMLRGAKPLKVLHLNTHDAFGGASRAAVRLLKALRRDAVDCQLLVQNRKSDEAFVESRGTNISKLLAEIRPYADRLPLLRYLGRPDFPYHSQWCPTQSWRLVKSMNPDLVHLHWICAGFVRIETVSKLRQPLIWTLHDMWPFTGGCHFSGSCTRYTERCGYCPQLSSQQDHDLSRWVIRRKEKSWRHVNLTIVSPSRWLAERARASRLFRDRPIVVIPNCIDSKRFKPIGKSIAREILGLPQDKLLISFSAMSFTTDLRKGFPLLRDALTVLHRERPGLDIEIILMGQSEPRDPITLAYPANYLGRLHDDVSIALSYASADVFVAPSTEDNLPNTVMEALACGTPSVAFNIGGMPDLIDHRLNGFLARPLDPGHLAQGIRWVLADRERNHRLSLHAREKVMKTFDAPVIAAKYKDLYQGILNADAP